jgi:glycerate 2-kinase
VSGEPSPEAFLRRLFQAAIDSASPNRCVPPALPEPPRGRTVVVGAGKAAAAMAQALESRWEGDVSGLVVTRYGHGAACRRIEVVEAAHPVPDAQGLVAARRIREMVSGLSKDDLVVCLLSGGGSALLVDPAPGVLLDDKQAVTRALLRSGAAIGEINSVRKHLSRIKGGRLALAAAPARVVTLAISDVPADDPSLIASGPTVPDPSTRQQALEVLQRYGIAAPASVLAWLESEEGETPKAFADGVSTIHIVATPAMAIQAAAAEARSAGWQVLYLGAGIEGESCVAARHHAAIVRNMIARRAPGDARCVVLSGGETTVKVNGKGRGGRNSEFLLALALELQDVANLHAIAADTDGVDGSEDNAGAMLLPGMIEEAERRGVSAAASLAANDSYGFFQAMNGLVFTGPTRTNVNDFRAIAISPAGS